MNRTIKLIAFAFVFIGCGRTQYYTERELDPDTVEAIKKHNMARIEGDWLHADDQEYVYFSFHGDSYSALIKRGNEILASDSGRIIHEMPNEIYLQTQQSGCSAREREVVVFNFDQKDADLLRFVDNESPWPFALKKSEPQEIPKLSLCLWNLTDKGRLRLKS